LSCPCPSSMQSCTRDVLGTVLQAGAVGGRQARCTLGTCVHHPASCSTRSCRAESTFPGYTRQSSLENALSASFTSFGQSRVQLEVGPGCSKVPRTQVLQAEHSRYRWLFPLLCRHQRVREPAWDLLPGHLPEPGGLLPLHLPPRVRGAERQLHR